MRTLIPLFPILLLVAVGCAGDPETTLETPPVDAPPERIAPEPEPEPEDPWAGLYDPDLAGKVKVVLRVEQVGPGEEVDNNWDQVRILGIIKNRSKVEFEKYTRVAHLGWERGVPRGECTVYLEPYTDSLNHIWKLYGGSARTGVTHQPLGIEEGGEAPPEQEVEGGEPVGEGEGEEEPEPEKVEPVEKDKSGEKAPEEAPPEEMPPPDEEMPPPDEEVPPPDEPVPPPDEPVPPPDKPLPPPDEGSG
ncbi:MAG: hypothetical protein ACYTAF_15020, partial [Planctomycetota bacterium]